MRLMMLFHAHFPLDLAVFTGSFDSLCLCLLGVQPSSISITRSVSLALIRRHNWSCSLNRYLWLASNVLEILDTETK